MGRIFQSRDMLILVMGAALSGFLDVVAIWLIMPFISLLIGVVPTIPGAHFVQDIPLIQLGAMVILFYIVKSVINVGIFRSQIRKIDRMRLNCLSELIDGYDRKNYFSLLTRNPESSAHRMIKEADIIFNQMGYAFLMMSSELFVVVLMTALLFSLNSTLALFALLWVVVPGLGYLLWNIRTLRKLGDQRDVSERSFTQLSFRFFTSIHELKLYGVTRPFGDRLKEVTSTAFNSIQRFRLIAELPRFMGELLAIVGMVAACVFTRSSFQSFEEQAVVLGSFAVAIFRMTPAFLRLVHGMGIFQFGKPALVSFVSELKELKDTDERSEKEKATTVGEIQSFELKNCGFQYPNRTSPTLESAALTLKKGMSLGIYGESGGGKSTLLSIIAGFLKPTRGEVVINGESFDHSPYFFQKKIGFVSQLSTIVPGTILENVIFFRKDITKEMALRALEKAQLFENVDMKIGSSVGVGLSAGQMKRVILARALAHSPEILLLDEATSQLDKQTEKSILNTLFSLAPAPMMIIVSHDSEPLERCDMKMKIEDGRLN